MKITKSPSNHSHYELLLRAYEKAFSVYERSVTDEKTAAHYLKISAKGTTKSELKILKLEYKRAKERRKSRHSGLKIVKLRIKQWLKTNDLDGKVYELPEVQINDIQPIIEERKRQKPGPKPSKNETSEAALPTAVVENVKSEPVPAAKTKVTRTKKTKVAVEEENTTEEAPTKATKKAVQVKDVAEPKPVKAAKVVAEKKVRPPKVEKTEEETPQKVEKTSSKNQDFTMVEGIGEKMTIALHEAGILTFKQLSNSTVEELKAVAYSIKNRFANPTTWPQQAKLVLENKPDELRKLQETLKGGKIRK